MELKKRSMDEMIAYFNREVSCMDLSAADKMKLLGMITAIGFRYKEDVQFVHAVPAAELSTDLASLGTDLISRQAAIDALTEYGNGRAVYIGVEEAVRRIEQLPSAEPELIKCDYVKACNEVTMYKTFSAWGYLAMLNDFKEYGYVLVKRRG